MERLIIEYDQGNSRVVTVPGEKDVNAFYTDEMQVPDYIIDEVVQMWNKGQPLNNIDVYLMDNEQVIQEDREEIIEGLYKLTEITNETNGQ